MVAFSQSVSVGQWRDYLPYANLNKVVESENYIYAASNYSLVEFDKRDNSISRLSKVNGLSDVGITALGYHGNTNTVIVGYEDGNVDFIKEGKIQNFADIKRASIVADKGVNAILVDGDNAYLACNFGIVELDMTTRLVNETFFIGTGSSYINVYYLTQSEDTLFAATENGIMYGIKSTELKNYNNWYTDNSFPYTDKTIDIIEYWNGKLLVNLPSDVYNSDTLIIKENGNWTISTVITGTENHAIVPVDDSVLISFNGEFKMYDSNLNQVYHVYNYNTSSAAQPGMVILGKGNVYWVADREFGLVQNPAPFVFDVMTLSSPYGIEVQNITAQDGHIWVAAGTKTDNYLGSFNLDGFYHRKPNQDWETYNRYYQDYMNNMLDILVVRPDPKNNAHVFAGSLNSGLLEILDGELVNIYNSSNSPLEEKSGNAEIGVEGLAFDSDGNLWITNMGTSNCLHVLTPEREWYTYNCSPYVSEETVGDLVIDDYGYKWILLPNEGAGILVYDDAGTLEDTDDDQMRLLTGSSGSGALPSTDVFSIAKDDNGEIWVGTNQGVAVFYNPGGMFVDGSSIDAQQIYVEVNGYTQYLLETETVKGIAIDGANRKWFATDGGGAFLMSEDGTEQIYHFTEENSPLLDNSLKDIEFDGESGEVFMATMDGIIAFKSTSTGGDASYSDVYAYPNPVPRNYTGKIAIKGLATNSSVRITDINGNLVFTTNAEGGQAIWDGNDMGGTKVQTGVYLVFSADEEGSETNITKIMVLN